VLCDENMIVRDWLHLTHQRQAFPTNGAHKTINLTRLNTPTATALLDHCYCVPADAPLEYAMRALVRARRVTIHAVDVQAARWCEVDTGEDLRLANELFAADGPD